MILLLSKVKGLVMNLTITQVSEKDNITPDTLRYYERIGLLPKVPRQSNG